MNIFEWAEDVAVTANNLNEMQNIINGNITTKISELTNVQVGTNYIKIGNIGVCWGQGNPTYNNANVMQCAVQLPLSFSNGRCIASTVNYNNQAFELDAITKVPSAVNGNGLTLALHSNGAKFTSGSTSFYINYLVIGQLAS